MQRGLHPKLALIHNTHQKCVYYEQPEFTYTNVDLVFTEVPKGATRAGGTTFEGNNGLVKS